MKELVMLDQRIIAMIQEVQAHPKLAEKMRLAELEGDKAHSTIFTAERDSPDIPVIQSFEQGVGFLAAQVDILVHGTYDYEGICDLCDKIRQRLVNKRTVVMNHKSPIILIN